MKMDTTANAALSPETVQEVRIVSGIEPNEVETVLTMAAASGHFSSDAMLSAEDMAWDSAYPDGGEEHTFLLAKVGSPDEEKVIGFLCFGPIARWAGEYEMYGIAVDPEYQRMGIGTGLVAEMSRRVADEMGNHVFLETDDDQSFEGVRCFYEANGFVYEHRFRKQFVPVEGGVVYRMDIEKYDVDTNYQ